MISSKFRDGSTTKNKLFVVLLALLGAGSVLIATHHFGVVVWPDSVFYISTARSLIKGGGFVAFDGEPLTLWPPLYPGILAFISSIFRTDPLFIAAVLNAIIFGGIIYLAGVILLKQFSSSPILAIEGTLATLFSIPLFSISVVAYSEPLFILLQLFAFICLDNYLSSKSIQSLVPLAVTVALAFLTRYIGVILLVWGGLLIVFINREGFKKRLTHLALFVSIGSIPTGVWLVRNLIVAHTLLGPRTPPVFSFIQILSYGLKNILDWYLPGAFTGHPVIMLIGSILAVVLIIFNLNGKRHWLKTNPSQFSPTMVLSISCGLFIILYAGFVVVSAIRTYVSVFESRIWSPIYIPLTLLIFILLKEAGKRLEKKLSGKVINSILIVSVGLGLVYPLISTVSNAIYLVRFGDGLGSAGWTKSPTVEYVRENKYKCTYYSNGPDVIYFQTGVNAKWVPSRGDVTSGINSKKGIWPPATKACLVWFEHIYRTSLFRPDELLPITNLEQVVKPSDGVIYIISRN
jgi:hypothetical protein